MFNFDKNKKRIAQLGQPTQLNVRPHQPAMMQTQPTAGEMLTQMALSKGLDKGLDKGLAFAGEKLGALTEGAKAATAGASTTAGATGAMGALGTAMPYVGAGLGLAKMLGLFSKGGKVGPLAKATYAADGEKVGLEFETGGRGNIVEEPYARNTYKMKQLHPLAKAYIREKTVREASQLEPEARARYIEDLRRKGISPDSMYHSGPKDAMPILEQLFGIK